jgi:ATP-dependent protease ClpP protease subunit
MNAEAAKDYGLIDNVLNERTSLPKDGSKEAKKKSE